MQHSLIAPRSRFGLVCAVVLALCCDVVTAQQQAPVRVGSMSRDRVRQIKDVPAVYPPDAPKLDLAGARVMVDITVGVDGKVVEARPIGWDDGSGGKQGPNVRVTPLVMQIALAAVKQWEFEPPTVNNESVPVITTVAVYVKAERPSASTSRAAFPRPWTYSDATMAANADPVESPLMSLKADLEAEGFRCIDTSAPDARGDIESRHVSTMVYLVHCLGECRGLQYGAAVNQGSIRHLGTSRGFPLVEVRAPFLADPPIRWQFSRNASGMPRIRVYGFAKGNTISGAGCDFSR